MDSSQDMVVPDVRVKAERFLLQPFFESVEECLLLMKDTDTIITNGALESLFDGGERRVYPLKVYVPDASRYAQWARFLVEENYVGSDHNSQQYNVSHGNPTYDSVAHN